MSEPDEAMVEAVAMAIRDDRGALDVDAGGIPDSQWRTLARAALSVPVVRDALARDGRAGCHAITGDGGTTYCPLAEANMRAVARDAQVRAEAEIEWGVEVIPGEIRWVSEAWLEDGGRPKANGVPLPVYRRTVMHGPWVLDERTVPVAKSADDSEEQR